MPDQSLSDIYKAVILVDADAMSTPKRNSTSTPPALTAEMQVVALGDETGAQIGVAGNPLVVSSGTPAPGAGAGFYNTAANTAGFQVKAGAGNLYGLSINTAGVTSSAELYDGTTTGDPKIGEYSTVAQGVLAFPSPGVAFADGLFLVLAGATPADVTVIYL